MSPDSLSSQTYDRRSFDEDAYQIQVPIVTAKERLRLDSAMPCADGWVPEEFEMDAEQVRLYREVYRFLPAYAKLLL